MSYLINSDELEGSDILKAHALTVKGGVISGQHHRKYVPGESCEFSYEGDWCIVEFLKHSWSGFVEIDDGKEILTVDLFSSEQSSVSIKLNRLDCNKEDISVVRIAPVLNRNGQSNGYEVWILNIEFSKYQERLNRSLLLNKSFSLIRGRWGEFLTLNSDNGISAELRNSGVWAEKDIDVFSQYIKEDETVIDIGANIGHHSVIFSKLVGDRGIVFSFEPQIMMFKLASSNLLLNRCLNTTIENLGLSNEVGKLKMYPIDYDDPNNYGALGIDPNPNSTGEEVQVSTLDNYFCDSNIENIHFIKIDVQAYEYFVLKGGVNLLKKYRPIVFVEISPYWMSERGYDYKEIYQFMFSLGYKVKHFGSNSDFSNTFIKDWNGQESEEWDIVAQYGC